jgi:hypothetical protein
MTKTNKIIFRIILILNILLALTNAVGIYNCWNTPEAHSCRWEAGSFFSWIYLPGFIFLNLVLSIFSIIVTWKQRKRIIKLITLIYPIILIVYVYTIGNYISQTIFTGVGDGNRILASCIFFAVPLMFLYYLLYKE